MDIQEILKHEPILRHIAESEAKKKDKQSAYVSAKRRAGSYVGFGARSEALSTPQAYDSYIDYLVRVIGL